MNTTENSRNAEAYLSLFIANPTDREIKEYLRLLATGEYDAREAAQAVLDDHCWEFWMKHPSA